MSFKLAWAVKCNCAIAGLINRQRQQEIKILKCKTDPMVVDLKKLMLNEVANIKTEQA
jgi:hypothetical protein